MIARLLSAFRREERAALGHLGTIESFAEARPAVSPDRAGGLSVVARCVSARAEAVASLPLRVFERGPDGERREAADHPLRRVLAEAFNPNLTAFEGRELLSRWADFHGNAYARIETNGRGEVVALHPIAPGSTQVEELGDGRLRYRVTRSRGQQQVLTAEEVLHVRHASKDGVLGVSPIASARETVALAAEMQEQALALSRNGARPSGALTFPTAVSPAALTHAKDLLNQSVVGAGRAGRILVLDGGMTWTPFGATNRDAEFAELTRASDLALARAFGVPPSIAGIPGGTTYASAYEEARAFVANCLAPWCRRFEAAMNLALFTEAQRRRYFVEFDLAGLLRGDPEGRFAAYKIGREAGVYSANDIRRLENLPPVDGGDTYLQPLNMGRLGEEGGGDGE